MNREIKFRARDIENTRWVYGYYEEVPVGIGKPTGIMHTFNDWNLNGHVEVNPETVGQYTGRKDKNGKEIYEGDILNNTSVNTTVAWFEDQGRWLAEGEMDGAFYWYPGNFGSVEIVGNIHEN